MRQFSLAGTLWLVAFVALGFAAVRNASNLWLGATFIATLGLLCASVLGAVLERSRGGVWWLGFALFGWAYFVAGLIPGLADTARMPSRALANWVTFASSPVPTAAPGGVPGMNAPNLRIGPDGRPVPPAPMGAARAGSDWLSYYRMHSEHLKSISGNLFVLLFARAGATVSCIFTKGLPWRRRPTSNPAPDSPPVA
jgi:hypothetical protein